MKLEEIRISKIKVGERVRKELGDIDQLVQSISKVGLLHPIVVRKDGGKYKLICGWRRLEACKSLGWDSIVAQVLEEGKKAWQP